jgi:hypothetical protein
MLFTDAAQVSKVRQTRDGYWIADCIVAKGDFVQRYLGSEVGRPELETVDVFRPASEVFSADSLRSFAYKPVVITHPEQAVDASTWGDVAVGTVGNEILRDGNGVRVSLALMDASAIEAVRSGTRQISMGYTCNVDFRDGITDDGTPYQAVQRDIRINHAALVTRGRAGPEAHFPVGDSEGAAATSLPFPPTESLTAKDHRDMPDLLRNVLVDGYTISVTDQGAQAIEKLQRQIADMTTAASRRDTEVQAVRDAHAGEVAALRSDHQKALDARPVKLPALASQRTAEVDTLKADHQKVVDSLTGEVAALKAKQPTADQMDALIADRANVIDAARGILGDKFDPKGKSNADIRREAASEAPRRCGGSRQERRVRHRRIRHADRCWRCYRRPRSCPRSPAAPAPKNPVNGVTTRDADDAYAAMVSLRKRVEG